MAPLSIDRQMLGVQTGVWRIDLSLRIIIRYQFILPLSLGVHIAWNPLSEATHKSSPIFSRRSLLCLFTPQPRSDIQTDPFINQFLLSGIRLRQWLHCTVRRLDGLKGAFCGIGKAFVGTDKGKQIFCSSLVRFNSILLSMKPCSVSLVEGLAIVVLANRAYFIVTSAFKISRPPTIEGITLHGS